MRTINLALCAIFAFLAVAKGHAEKEFISYSNLQVLAHEYLNLTRTQHSKVLEDYGRQIESFEKRYLGRIEGVHIQEEVVTASIVQIEERLIPLRDLSDLSKQCISKYRIYIPSVVQTKKSITRCAAVASKRAAKTLTHCIDTRNALQSYYTNNYEKEVEYCSKNSKSIENFAKCIISEASKAYSVTIDNQKKFGNYMEAAECAAKAYIMRALDCSYIEQTRVTTQIAEINLLLNNCLATKVVFQQYSESTCPNTLRLSAEILQHKTIANPFYVLKSNAGCIKVSFEKDLQINY